jgi:hypothetical protein
LKGGDGLFTHQEIEAMSFLWDMVRIGAVGCLAGGVFWLVVVRPGRARRRRLRKLQNFTKI